MPTFEKHFFLVEYNKYFIDMCWNNHPDIIPFGFNGDGILNKDYGYIKNLRKVLDTISDELVCLIQDDVIIVSQVNEIYFRFTCTFFTTHNITPLFCQQFFCFDTSWHYTITLHAKIVLFLSWSS